MENTPTNFLELMEAGGPQALARAAAKRAANEERAFWLRTLEAIETFEDAVQAAICLGYIQTLRRQLGLKAPIDQRRALARERVRRFRAKRRAIARAANPEAPAR
jgi:hypothetical protein